MKEIDFIPEWYKSGRRRQTSYRTQYVALGGVFVVMVVWNFVAAHSISKASAELTLRATKRVKTENASREFARVKSEVTEELQKKAEAIGEIDSKIDVASVLGEMSFLIEADIVLSKVEFFAERFANNKKGKPNSRSAVRVARGSRGGRQAPPLGNLSFKVVISGVASEASDVAELVCKLEDSPYFGNVIPSFSQNKKIKAGTGLAREDFQVSEFEISCYLANYKKLIADN
jgi:hypothetical protein